MVNTRERLPGASSEGEGTLVHEDGKNPALRHRRGKQGMSEFEL